MALVALAIRHHPISGPRWVLVGDAAGECPMLYGCIERLVDPRCRPNAVEVARARAKEGAAMAVEQKTEIERKIAEAEHTVAEAQARIRQLDAVLEKTDQALLGAERFGEGLHKAAPKVLKAAVVVLGLLVIAAVGMLARRSATPDH